MTEKPKLPSLELIEEMHSFPSKFTFKAIADHRQDLIADVLTLVADTVGATREISHSHRMSSKGNHIAVTIDVFVENAHEVHSIYTALLAVQGLRALF